MFRDVPAGKRVGDDMQVSSSLKKKGIRSFIPPHPTNDRELWGSIDGQNLGTSPEAISMDPGHREEFNACYKRLVENGWVTLAMEKKP